MSINASKSPLRFLSDSAVAIFFIIYTYILSLVPVYCGLSHIYAPLYIVYFALIICRLIFDRNFFDNHGNGYLILFTIAFCISFALNGFVNSRNNLISGATIIASFFLFYSGSPLRKKDDLLKLTKNISKAGMVIFGINSIISLILFLSDISILYHNENGRAFYLGINSAEGRFTGLQGNPNIFGWVSLAGLCCSVVYLMFTHRKSKLKFIGSILSVFLQIICVGFSLSRGAFYGMIIGIFFMLLTRILTVSPKIKFPRLLNIVLLAVMSVALVFIGNLAFSTSLEIIDDVQSETMPTHVDTDRLFQTGDSWSTGRTFLIKAGMETLKNNNAFIFGVSPGAAEERWVNEVDISYSDIDSQHYVVSEGAGNMHNLFLQTLYVMGAVGLIILLGFVFFIGKTFFRSFVKSKVPVSKEDCRVISGLIFVIFSLGTVAMVDNILIYGSGVYNVLFMLCLGILVKLLVSVYGPEVAYDRIDSMLKKPFMLANNKIHSMFRSKNS